MKKYITLIKRECWENKFSIFLVPAVLVVLSIGLLLLADFTYPDDTKCIAEGDTIHCDSAGGMNAGVAGESMADAVVRLQENSGESTAVYEIAIASIGFPFFILMLLVMASYLLSSLSDDQKDKSVMFWNSLPISHTETVLSKWFCASVFIPMVTIVAIAITQIVAMIILSAANPENIEKQVSVWGSVSLLSIWGAYLVNYLVFTVSSMAVIGLMLCVSATTAPPNLLLLVVVISIIALEYIVFGQHGGLSHLFTTLPVTSTTLFGYDFDALSGVLTSGDIYTPLTGVALNTVSGKNLWLALVVGIALIVAAINLRKYRTAM